MWIAASVADTAAVIPNGIKTLLADGLRTYPIKGNQVFSNCPEGPPKNPPDCPILCNWVFDNLVLPEKLFAEALKSFETFALINNLCGNLFSSLESPKTFDEISKVTLVPFLLLTWICWAVN